MGNNQQQTLSGKWWCCCLLLLSCPVTQMVHADPLENLISAARQHDAGFRAARAQYEATLTKIPQAFASLLPNINLSANYNKNGQKTSYDGGSQAPLSRNFDTHGYTLQLNQPVFRFNNIATWHQAEYLVAQAEAQLAQADNDLTFKVAQACYDYLSELDGIELLQAQREATAEQAAAAEKSYKIGAAAITDLQEARAKLALIQAQEIEARNEADNRRRQLRTLAGPGIKDPQPLAGVRLSLPPGDMESWLARSEESATVKAARAAVNVADEEISKARSGHYPTLDLVVSHSSNLQGPSAALPNASRTRSESLGLQLQVPLYAGGGVSAKVQEALQLRDKALEEQENALRQIKLQIAQAYSDIQSGVARIEALELGVKASEEAHKSNKRGYTLGMRTGAEVLNAQQQVFAARRELKKAKYKVLLQRLKLETLTGSNATDMQKYGKGRRDES